MCNLQCPLPVTKATLEWYMMKGQQMLPLYFIGYMWLLLFVGILETYMF